MEVTREEAEYILWEASQPGSGEEAERFVDYAREAAGTVVALYDTIDAMPALAQTLMAGSTMLLIDGSLRAVRDKRGTVTLIRDDRAAMRECIDRLRDGWLAIEWHDGVGLVWVPGRVGLTEAMYEPMTPEQRAVMAR